MKATARSFQAPKGSGTANYMQTTTAVSNYKLLRFSFVGNFSAKKFFRLCPRNTSNDNIISAHIVFSKDCMKMGIFVPNSAK